MAIQLRRGNYSDLDTSRLLAGELAVVLEGDPTVSDGQMVYVCFGSTVKRVATWEDAAQLIAEYIGEVADISIEGTGAIEAESDEGTWTIAHKAQWSGGVDGLDPSASGAGEHDSMGGTTLASGGSFWVPCVNIDRYGHVTGTRYRKFTLPEMGGKATLETLGDVKPDGDTIGIDASGVISVITGGLDVATASGKGVMSADDKSKLDGIEARANRYTHPSYTARTGKPTTSQTPSFGDTFTVSRVTSDSTGHVSGMDDRTVKIPDTTATQSAAGLMSATDKAKLDGVTTGAQANVIETVKVNGTALTPSGKAVDVTVPTKASDLTNDAGYLDAEGPFDATRLTGTVPAANLPSYVDDVVEGYLYQGAFYEESAHATAIAGEAGKVYVDLADDSTYRWSGSAYVSISNPIDFATQAEAEGGVENTKAMTALRTKQAIDANAYAHPTSAASGSYGDASDQAPAWGGTFKATSQTVDANGHVTAAAEHTVTIPSSTATDAAAGLMSAADHAALTAAVVDVTNLDARVTSLEHPVPEWDDDAGRYTDESVAGWLGNMRDGLSYGVSVPKGSATACTKTGANAGIAVPVPGIVGRAAVDPYALLGPFRHFDVNGYVDPDGTPHVTAIQGDGRFKRDGTNGNVWVLAPVLWWSMDSGGDVVEIYVSDTRLAGMAAQPQAYLPDGTLRPFMLYAKYVGSNDGGGMMASVSGRKPWTYNVSHNSLITQCKNATTGYSGKSIADDWYPKVMLLLKYATKNSQGVLAGCTDYNYQYTLAVAETNVTRVVLTKAQAANLLVGSACMLGTHTGNNDRSTASNYNLFDGLAITKIEDYDETRSAVYFDTPTPFDTETTYYLSTSPWRTGSCDAVEGDGSPTNPLSGKEPFVLQGIEMAVGLYEVVGDVIVNSDGSTGWEICICHDSRGEATSVTANYTHTGKFLHSDTTDSWKYPMYPDSADGMLFGASYGASQSTGMCDGSYTNKKTTSGTREWRGLGNLNGAGNAGLWCVYASGALTLARWDIGSRLSATGRALAA